MKTLLLTLITTVCFSSLFAQKSWHAPLKTQLENANSVETLDQLKNVLGGIERIALAEKEEWLPNYYAAYYNVINFWWGKQTNANCENCLDKMNEFLTVAEASDNNSEVVAMRAYYYQGMLNADPSKAPVYGPKATGLLQKAIGMDANNARAHLLLGQNLYYTPVQYGGGLDQAKPYLEKADELLKEQEAKELLPSWGRDDLTRVMSTIKE